MRLTLALAGALLVAHVAFGLARIPHAVIVKRWREVAELQREGDAQFVFRTAFLSGAEAITTLRRQTAPDAVVGVRGVFKGALEFAPALLWPRICRSIEALPVGAATVDGRPVAAQVLVGDGKTLRLEPR